jgi:hypothetical protein
MHRLRIQQFRVLGFFGCPAVFLAQITNGSAQNLQRQFGVHRANGFLGSLLAKEPRQSPVGVAAIVILQ